MLPLIRILTTFVIFSSLASNALASGHDESSSEPPPNDTIYLNTWSLTNIFGGSGGEPFYASGALVFDGFNSYSGQVNLVSDSIGFPAGVDYSSDWTINLATGQIETLNSTCTQLASAALNGCTGLFGAGINSFSTSVDINFNSSDSFSATYDELNPINNVHTFGFSGTELPQPDPEPEPEPEPPVVMPPVQDGNSFALIGAKFSNIFTDTPIEFTLAEGVLTGETIISGEVTLVEDNSPAAMEYSADWAIDLEESKLYTSNIQCQITNALDSCSTFLNGSKVEDITVSTDEFGNTVIVWEDFSSGINNVYSFTIAPSAVPIPAAAWLFGSALVGLIGVKRNK
ncbi:VPLPA-CTERM sorting domain-containing protein [Oceanicoccus sp. KOV_DT_Chl]|uniref:VPLPA-CTERM sorting domain-containing protein n=1 Tax=Oceanicoccus sp. KOV_DT_Chl TaxID=1904639 RepID=UPI000C7E8262|nr:VPLPA-CTERM sorting domain-containing protein [Oceanicoccus sp. KOV_DT_Chl]